LSYAEVIQKLSKHFHRVAVIDDEVSGEETAISLIPVSLSTTTSEGDMKGSPSTRSF